jgi:ubiquinone/menaquinone biosynthesis C-methylase UbiE
MALNKRWLVPTLAVGAALVYTRYRRRDLDRLVENIQRYSAPSAVLYDALAAPVLGGFFTRVAHDLVALDPRAHVLEVGSGPGRLAARLAALAPEIRVTGVDITPEMVARANALAARSGLAGRVAFRVGDVANLPLPDASFDVVVSTFSLHHWPDPGRGLAEIYRVLRPGGVARIYDVVDWIRRFEQGGAGIAELATKSPFGACVQIITTGLGPIPLVYRADLRRAPPGSTTVGEG